MRKQGAPLCSKNFVKAIFQTKKKCGLFFITLLCWKSAAPHHLASQGASPQGEAAKRLCLLLEQKNRTRYAPHQSTTLTASPRGEALKRLTIFSRQGENFFIAIIPAMRKQGAPLISQLRWQLPPEGKPWKRLTIFAEENEGTEFSAGKGKPWSGWACYRAKTIEQGTPLISQLRWQLPPKGKPFLLIYICVTPYYYWYLSKYRVTHDITSWH